MGTSRCIRRELFCLSQPPFPTQLRLEAMVERSCPAVLPVPPSFSVLQAHFFTRVNSRTPAKTVCGLTNNIGHSKLWRGGARACCIIPHPPQVSGRISLQAQGGPICLEFQGGIRPVIASAALPPWWTDCTYLSRNSYGRRTSLTSLSFSIKLQPRNSHFVSSWWKRWNPIIFSFSIKLVVISWWKG